LESGLRKLGVALIGAGPFGAKRARAVASNRQCRLVVVVDSIPERAQGVAREFGCEAEADWQSAIGRSDVDAVIVSTPTQAMVEISLLAVQSGKHTLAEKPVVRAAEEARPLVEAARAAGVHL